MLELIDGPLFSMPDMVPQPLNIRDNVARQHQEILPRIGQAVQGVHPLFEADV